MPNIESAKKRVRQTKKRNAVNLWRKRRIKDETKAFLTAIASGDVAAAETEFRKVAGLLDRIACTSTLHRNTAGRRKSRLARRLNLLKSGGSAALAAEKSAKRTKVKSAQKSAHKAAPGAKSSGSKPAAS